MTAERLLTGDTSISDPTVDDFGLSRYIADTGPAWHSTAGALEWLQRILNGPYVRHTRDSLAVAAQHRDQARWKRWEDTLERADHYLMQGDASEAKKLYKSALREAERIDYSAGPFDNTMTALVDLADESGDAFGEFRARILDRAARLSSDSSAKEPIHALHYQSFGMLFIYMHDYAMPAQYLEKALTEIDHHLAEGHPNLTLLDADETRYELALSLFELKRYSDAIAVLVRGIELLQSYLGPRHVRFLESLELMYKCMQHADDKAGADSTRQEMLSIDEFYFDESPTPDGTACHSCGLDHD